MTTKDWHNLFCCVFLISLNVGLWVTGNYTVPWAITCALLLILWLIG